MLRRKIASDPSGVNAYQFKSFGTLSRGTGRRVLLFVPFDFVSSSEQSSRIIELHSLGNSMPQVINCPNCSKSYQIADSSRGNRVRCQQCGTTFTFSNPATSSALASGIGPHPGTQSGHSQYPTHGSNPAGGYATAPHVNARVSNPSGGPTDTKLRLAACGALGFALVLILISVAMVAFTGSVFMVLLALVPLCLFLGFTGLISPNVIRAMGQYGSHLPTHYKFIGWGLMSFSIILMFPMMIVLYIAGFRTDTPRPRPQFRQVNAVPQEDKSASPAKAQPATQEKKVVQSDADLTKNSSNMKPRKSYPVSIKVPEHSVFVPPNTKLAAGTRLEACWSEKWNPITTLSENDDGSLNVRWDDFGEKFDCSMVRSELIIRKDVLNPSLRSPNPISSAATPSENTTQSADGVPSEPKPLKKYPVTIAVPADSQFVPAAAKLQPGTRLQACWSGKWNPITLLSENKDGTLTVRWDDFGSAYDCSMLREELIIKK
jgi:predicted Zn finger-like uncharacterized protein